MDATTAISSSVALTQTQFGIAALRLANQSQEQLIALLAQSAAQPATSNPPNLGNQIDTFA
jgi:hypothetical protein